VVHPARSCEAVVAVWITHAISGIRKIEHKNVFLSLRLPLILLPSLEGPFSFNKKPKRLRGNIDLRALI
jgi:hypothetical protein